MRLVLPVPLCRNAHSRAVLSWQQFLMIFKLDVTHNNDSDKDRYAHSRVFLSFLMKPSSHKLMIFKFDATDNNRNTKLALPISNNDNDIKTCKLAISKLVLNVISNFDTKANPQLAG